MGVVKYATGIDRVSGSLSKPKVKQGHQCGTYLIGTHRTAPTTNPECTRLFIKDADTYKRVTPLTPDEIAARNRFKAVAALVKARKSNVQYITTDQENFIAQKNTPGGKKTMKAYYWSICGAEYDANH